MPRRSPGDLPADPADAGADRHAARDGPDAGHRHAARDLVNEMGYQLTDAGKARALDALSQSEYYGAMPVPLEDYASRSSASRSATSASPATCWRLHGPPDPARGLIDQLGPAVTSGRSVLMYGPPGNGKSSIAEGIRAAMGDISTSPTRCLRGPGHHHVRPDRAYQGRGARRPDLSPLRRTGRATTRATCCARGPR
jgi:hypothetical protein